ncbi:hypothetical protein Ciccas_002170 [Cichlidogyrus casuarinus]|uniref:Galactosyltransferase C-terminal domain-containing protein n=1 Tax=Cichlidogyrus casuarinus TaxID=1844966 RepID=A0ABD2QHY2_9PLAT
MFHLEVPVIDQIDEFDSTYTRGSPELMGDIVSYDLTFRWRLEDHLNVTNVKTPVLSGAAFAVKKEPFFRFGAFDPGMDIWGGENIELSFRAWLCGGSIEIVPESHIGHIFKSTHTYTFPAGKYKTVLKNLKRVALVWFLHNASHEKALEHLSNFYQALPQASLYQSGDLAERRLLLKQLNCSSFDYFFERSGSRLIQQSPVDAQARRKALFDIDAVD